MGKLSRRKLCTLIKPKKKKKVYKPGEEFHNQVTDNFVELVTGEETGELLEEVLLYYQLKNKC